MKDYKAMYEALVKDIKENAVRDICEICIGMVIPCVNDDELECDNCKLECRCRSCVNCSAWKWRGETDE